jgi:hypothetical protein
MLLEYLFSQRELCSSSKSLYCHGIKPTPPFVEMFLHKAATDASNFILKHLDHFLVEMLRSEIISKIILALKKESEDDGIPEDSTEHALLSHYLSMPPSYTTVLCWVHYLGFSQDKVKKSYYVDGHEHEDKKKHCSEFTQKCLSHLEFQSCRWVQMSIEKAKSIKSSIQQITSLWPPDTSILIL